MGREIRRVPADWEHPRDTNKPDSYWPLYDNDYETACEEWWKNAVLWSKGEHPDQTGDGYRPTCKWFWDWEGRSPDEEMYRERRWTPEEATHYQVYETVSEGTPVSPAFATKEELIDYLVENGDFWCQRRSTERPPSREAATAFVNAGWVMTGMAHVTPQGTDIKFGIESAEFYKK